jgi:hypothetical protein
LRASVFWVLGISLEVLHDARHLKGRGREKIGVWGDHVSAQHLDGRRDQVWRKCREVLRLDVGKSVAQRSHVCAEFFPSSQAFADGIGAHGASAIRPRPSGPRILGGRSQGLQKSGFGCVRRVPVPQLFIAGLHGGVVIDMQVEAKIASMGRGFSGVLFHTAQLRGR